MLQNNLVRFIQSNYDSFWKGTLGTILTVFTLDTHMSLNAIK